MYSNLLALLGRYSIDVTIVAEVERMMSNLNLVASGAGVTVVPASMKGAHPNSVVYRKLEARGRLDAPITIAWREDDADGATATFLKLARRLAAARSRSQPKSRRAGDRR
jgi:DNA-binding transcriptional LysR family regulator